MKPQQSIFTRKSRMVFVTLAGAALAVGFAAIRARADEWDKKTTLTINQPMQVRDTVLEPGQYVFKLLNSDSDRHIVQIFNGDQSHLIDTVLAIPNYRLQVTGHSRFVMWETPSGSVNALRAWFYPGDNFGQEFPYPKHLRQVAMAVAAPLPPALPLTETAPAPPAVAEPAPPEPPAQPQAALEEHAEGQPAEVAESAPAPPPVTTPEPPQSSTAPATLPKTASPYPAFGVAGAALLALGGLLRKAYSS
jgi:LPXTG-motif cell wall-anchored protein